MMTMWWIFAGVLLLNVAIGLSFLTSRKGSADSLLAVLLFGTTGVALALVLGKATEQEYAVDMALVFALLAAVIGVAFVRRGWVNGDGEEDGGS